MDSEVVRIPEMCRMRKDRVSKFSVKGQVATTFIIAGHTVSVAVTPSCLCSTKAVTGDT